MIEENELETYLSEFDDDYMLCEEQRDLASEDMRFSIVPGGQWEGWKEDLYGEERTKLELDMVNQACEDFMSDFGDNRVNVNFSPTDSATTDKDSNLMQGIYRQDFRQGRGKQSLTAAVSESVRCGFGALQLRTVYEDDEDPDNELQTQVFKYIPNAYSCVSFDSNAVETDKSDAGHVTVIFEYEKKAFEEEYPEASTVSVSHDDYRFS